MRGLATLAHELAHHRMKYRDMLPFLLLHMKLVIPQVKPDTDAGLVAAIGMVAWMAGKPRGARASCMTTSRSQPGLPMIETRM